MLRYFAFIFFSLVSFFITAQVKPPVKSFTEVPVTIKVEEIEFPEKYPDAQFNAVDSLLFSMDSLIRPFYNFRYNTITKQSKYRPKYRVSVNELTGDTTFIPLPKLRSYIASISKLEMDTLKVSNPIKPVVIDTTVWAKDPIWWENSNSFGLDINEAAFVNWNAGGNNSITGIAKVNFIRNYKKLYILWKNQVFVRYGLNSQEDKALRKTDDRVEINSTFGYRRDTISNWYYTVKTNFRTQFTDGFSYPNRETPISRFFAPAYLFLGAGAQYDSKKNNFSIYISPVTLKSTFVLDDALSEKGSFGVEKGKKTRNEFGALIEASWKQEILKNILMTHKIDLYSDYLNSFGNIDMDWQINFLFKINKNIKANLGAHLIYDDDIKYREDINGDGTLETLGARLQIKQVFGIGFVFSF